MIEVLGPLEATTIAKRHTFLLLHTCDISCDSEEGIPPLS